MKKGDSESEESVNSDSDTNDINKKNQQKSKKFKETNQWSEWGRDINEAVTLIKKIQIGDRVNAHYMPTFAQKLLNDLCDLPLWSCVVRDDFGFGRIPASSACVESEFNKTKNLFLKNEVLPMRVDEYIGKYVNYINGRLKIINSRIAQPEDIENKGEEDKNNKFNTSNERSTNDLSISLDLDHVIQCPACTRGDKPTGSHRCFICHTPVHNLDECASPFDLKEGFGQKRIYFKCKKQDNISVIVASRHKENWGNETEGTSPVVGNKITKVEDNFANDTGVISKKKKAKYYGEKPHLIKEQLQFHGKRRKIVILKNGNNDSLRPVTINNQRVNAILTCAFDSVYQIIAAAVCDWSNFRLKIKNDGGSNQILKLAVNLFEEQTSFAAAYETRARFHYDFVEHIEQPDGSILLCCETSVMQIVLRMFESTPSCTIAIACSQCSVKEEKNIIAPIAYMSDIIDGRLDIAKLTDLCMVTRCRSEHCKGKRVTSISKLGEMIILEILNARGECQMNLDTLPKDFINPLIADEKYRIVGAVAYEPPGIQRKSSTDNSGGHFVAMCLRGTEWYEYDDLKETDKLKKGKTEINLQILIYVKI